jgi:hypothetical protein
MCASLLCVVAVQGRGAGRSERGAEDGDSAPTDAGAPRGGGRGGRGGRGRGAGPKATCRNFLINKCQYGDACHFSHAGEDADKKLAAQHKARRAALDKKIACIWLVKGTVCPYGGICRHSHDATAVAEAKAGKPAAAAPAPAAAPAAGPAASAAAAPAAQPAAQAPAPAAAPAPAPAPAAAPAAAPKPAAAPATGAAPAAKPAGGAPAGRGRGGARRQ